MEKKFYVYKHVRLDTGLVFYIGKGHGKRAWSSKNRNPYWNNIAKLGYSVELVKTNLTEEESFSLEIEMIKLHKSTLVNMTEGGEGSSGRLCSLDTKNKISESLMSYKITENHRMSISRSVAGSKNGMYGKNHSYDSKLKIKNNKIGKKLVLSQEGLKNKARGCKIHKSKLVINTETGIIFECARAASDFYKIPLKSLYKMLSGYRDNKTTLRYLEK